MQKSSVVKPVDVPGGCSRTGPRRCMTYLGMPTVKVYLEGPGNLTLLRVQAPGSRSIEPGWHPTVHMQVTGTDPLAPGP